MEIGIHKGIKEEDYHADPALGQSYLKNVLKRSVVHARMPQTSTKSMSLGSALHCAFLEPERFLTDYANSSTMPVKPECDARTKAGKIIRDQFNAELENWMACNEGKVILNQTDWANVLGMLHSLKSHTEVATMFALPHDREISLRWDDPEVGLPCKARFDYYCQSKAVVADLKTTQDASDEEISKALHKWGYHVQAGYYLDGLRTLTGQEAEFRFIFVESSEPWAVRVVSIAQRAANFGLFEARRGLYKHDEESLRIREGIVQPYDEGVIELDLPPWAYGKSGW